VQSRTAVRRYFRWARASAADDPSKEERWRSAFMKDSLCFVHRPKVMLPNRAIEVKNEAPGLWLERGTMQLLVVSLT